MKWLVIILALFLVYMAFESWLSEYHNFKEMEHERYLKWLEENRPGE